MGKKLNNAPVYYTVAQVQFNPVLDLDAYIPAIQAKMREKHFPDFKQDVVQRLVLPFGTVEPGQLAAPTVTPQSRYQFGDITGSARFVLETNALSFQTTGYETFEAFSGTLLAGLSVVHDALRLDFIERIGLRYLDAVQPSGERESLRDFLVPEVLGLSMREGVQHQHSVSETIVATPAGQLVSRVLIRHGQVGLPLELTALAPKIDPRFTQWAGLHAIIDTDASTTQREAFDLGNVEAQLKALHDEIDKCFKAIVTKHALAAWA
ncbi:MULTISPECIES: TIGR04255 family protein [Burkholderiaceae]|uniref:TIGR04255 family protein n=1 Tax=Burkholderiaceae TaxID=119060 RepID=UPI0020191628|nr:MULTISPECIES: TIGR04255 family protein [Burkholderiaceae]MCL4629242.1 TIGR04255 family protein [Burkholderia multivorans]MCO1388468.1 TIGR04255 family protein [Burkholderia multivorans]MDN7450825.1 TIGR04255 family protein [Burkholderia multivorans]UQO11613.1 TIGR04255 family protein [Burkholderia multivorans]UQO56508.1 TIGR04255 family protein [Burkholderia multivorans]